jgi:endo-1,4-beta-D-glucanase Y
MKKKLSALLGCVLFLNMISIPIPASAQTLTNDTKHYYEDWKETYLRQNPYVKDETQYYVFYGEKEYAEAHSTVEVTVSEAHGYGMLITALMSDYDSEAKNIFDGMYHYYLAHPSSIGPHLMAWQQSDNGKALVDSNGADSATDGDLDIAYALLLADKVWGSSGEINYRQAAELVIDDIMKYDVSHDDNILRLGDWAYDVDKNDKYYTATRASDFIMQYFPVFYEVTGDERWMQLYDNTYGIINHFVEKYQTGLLPDFIIKDSSGEWIPAPANFLENENDGVYEYNSCRVPWRISTDALVGKNEDAKKYAETVNAFFVNETGGNPEKIMAGYTPDGKAVADWDDLCFTAPLMLSAAASGDTKWHDTVRKEVLDIGVDSYFGNTIAVLCLITDDGGWLVPETTAAKPTGDVNDDGEFNVADVVLLQKWLLAVPDTHLANWETADFCSDNKLDTFDLVLMRKNILISISIPVAVSVKETGKFAGANTVRKVYREGDKYILSYEDLRSSVEPLVIEISEQDYIEIMSQDYDGIVNRYNNSTDKTAADLWKNVTVLSYSDGSEEEINVPMTGITDKMKNMTLEYMELQDLYVKPAHLSYGPTFYVPEQGVKLYSGPDESYRCLADINSFSTLHELGFQADNDPWLFTEYNGIYGWIRTKDENNKSTVIYEQIAAKPVIYLYPEKETDVHVELELTEAELSTTYPKYNNGWDVTAYPDGSLLNKSDGTHHKYLFWDAVNCRTRFDFSKGFCVAGSDTESFLKEKLTYIGLTEDEMNEFIVY